MKPINTWDPTEAVRPGHGARWDISSGSPTGSLHPLQQGAEAAHCAAEAVHFPASRATSGRPVRRQR